MTITVLLLAACNRGDYRYSSVACCLLEASTEASSSSSSASRHPIGLTVRPFYFAATFLLRNQKCVETTESRDLNSGLLNSFESGAPVLPLPLLALRLVALLALLT